MGGEKGGKNRETSGPLDVATLNELLEILGDVITVSGGGLAIAAFLRQSRQVLEAFMTSRARREITIKADGVTVQIKGSNDIDKALRAFDAAAQTGHDKSTLKGAKRLRARSRLPDHKS